MGLAKPQKLGKLGARRACALQNARPAHSNHIFDMKPKTQNRSRSGVISVMRGLEFGVFGQLR
jgi:hypothetical protein